MQKTGRYIKLLNLLKRNDGFTIQEILVALIVGSILIGLSLSLFLFTSKLFQTWYGSSELKRDANRILQRVAMDIQQSKEIIEHSDTSFVISKGVGKIVQYSFNGKSLCRNEVDLTPVKATAIKMRIEGWKENIPTELQGHLYNIKLFVQSKSIDYIVEVDAMMIPCARSQFQYAQRVGQ